jgi:hypothetical protein
VETFSERLEKRARIWWKAPTPGSGRTLGDAAHRLRERSMIRSRCDPDEAWRCCEAWPRTLVHKWNGRELAARHGCPLPELYWRGPARAMPPPESLPECFVIRTVRGSCAKGVRVVSGDRELLRSAPATPDELRRSLAWWRRKSLPATILVEELVRPEDGGDRLPPEVKCHSFAGTVGAIEYVERVSIPARSRRFYTPGWEPFAEQMDTDLPLSELRGPPARLDLMVDLAGRIGAFVGTYIRLDFFVGDRGCVFNEFSTVPGLRGYFTPFAEELFGGLWQESCPDRI